MLVARKTKSLSARDCRIEAVQNVEQLLAYRVQWDDLAKHCEEPNVFYESFMLVPALKHLMSKDEIESCRFYLVWSANESDQTLLGFFPFMAASNYHGVPVPHLVSLQYCHCYLSTPLLRSGSEDRCWEAFISHVSKSEHYSFYRLSAVGGEEKAYNQGLKAAKKAGQHFVETDKHVRACMKPEASIVEYLRLHVSRKVVKDIRRKFRRLEEQGVTAFKVMGAEEHLSDWVMEFMELEAKGWKGRERVAIVNDVRHMQFLREVCSTAYAQGKLHLIKLMLDDQPIAMKCAFKSGNTLFAFKIAYDEEFANSSPGLLLEYEHLQWLCNQEEILWVDSCMKPNDFMISRLWKDSRIIRFVNITCSGGMSKMLISLVPFVKRFRDSVFSR